MAAETGCGLGAQLMNPAHSYVLPRERQCYSLVVYWRLSSQSVLLLGGVAPSGTWALWKGVRTLVTQKTILGSQPLPLWFSDPHEFTFAS